MRSTVSSIAQWAAATLALLIAPYYSIRTWASVVDPDIWWHIRTGDWILANHAVPRFAIFSQHSERPWIAYSWLFDVIVSGVQHRFGLVGIPDFLICLQLLLSLIFLLAIQHFFRRLRKSGCRAIRARLRSAGSWRSLSPRLPDPASGPIGFIPTKWSFITYCTPDSSKSFKK